MICEKCGGKFFSGFPLYCARCGSALPIVMYDSISWNTNSTTAIPFLPTAAGWLSKHVAPPAIDEVDRCLNGPHVEESA